MGDVVVSAADAATKVVVALIHGSFMLPCPSVTGPSSVRLVSRQHALDERAYRNLAGNKRDLWKAAVYENSLRKRPVEKAKKNTRYLGSNRPLNVRGSWPFARPRVML